MNRRETGNEKERLARRYLEERGYQILATNYRCRNAELDIVARDADELVFVEVKYRKNAEYGGSLYAVSAQKMRKISLGARYYIYRERVPQDTPMRFDVIAIDGETIRHVINAFEAVE